MVAYTDGLDGKSKRICLEERVLKVVAKKEGGDARRMAALVSYELWMDHGGNGGDGAAAKVLLSMGNRKQ